MTDDAAMGVVERWLHKLRSNVCPHCDAPIAQQEQVGRCVYARPCGHRLYQGIVGAFAPAADGVRAGGTEP